ncbi:MAG: hypothetical protein Q7S22_03320 [Candidatus Micrarchaeota archaeon]|nr:hypothetical protein [Candidatus Micrarchaeota archaeon]
MAIQQITTYGVDQRAAPELRKSLSRYLSKGGNPNELPFDIGRHFEFDGKFFSLRDMPLKRVTREPLIDQVNPITELRASVASSLEGQVFESLKANQRGAPL